MSSYAVVTEDVEVDLVFGSSGVLGIILSEPEGDQLSADLTLVEARALRDWLSKVLEDA